MLLGNFLIPQELLKITRKNLAIEHFIGIDSFERGILDHITPYFKNIYSQESCNTTYDKAVIHYRPVTHIEIIKEMSSGDLLNLYSELSEFPVFYCLTPSSIELLIQNLKAITSIHPNSFFMIHQTYLLPIEEIYAIIKKISSEHSLTVINHCLLFFPKYITCYMDLYLQNQNKYWLETINKSLQVAKTQDMLRHKKEVILTLSKNTPLKHYLRKTKIFLKIVLGPILRLVPKPKIGSLIQHHPKELALPNYYCSKPPEGSFIPTVSLVTPSFNQGIFLEKTIKSVLSQNYPRLEYIIQDGGSYDSTTMNILNHYNLTLKHWESKPDNGQSQAINLGFQHATGEIMAYLNSDDLLLPGSLHYIADYFTKHPDIDVVYGHRILIDENDKEIGRWILPQHDAEILNWTDYIPQETLFWRRSIWEKAGNKIDENFKFAMDWDLLLRFQAAGAKFVRLPRFLGAFRVHNQQKTNAEISSVGIKEMQQLRQKIHGRNVSAVEVKKATRKYLYKHLFHHFFYKIGLLRY